MMTIPYNKLISKLQKLVESMSALEYALIAALIGVGILLCARAVGTGTKRIDNNLGTAMTTSAPRSR